MPSEPAVLCALAGGRPLTHVRTQTRKRTGVCLPCVLAWRPGVVKCCRLPPRPPPPHHHPLQDGSFYVWAAGSFALLRSFTLPVAPALRTLQSTFALSPDGQLLVSGASGVPLLFVYSAISGALLHAVVLPAPDTAAAAAGGVQLQQSGAAGSKRQEPLPPLELGASLAGAQQLQFLEDAVTVAGEAELCALCLVGPGGGGERGRFAAGGGSRASGVGGGGDRPGRANS